MKAETRAELDAYYKAAETWATDKAEQLRGSRQRAWIIAVAAIFVAVAEAIALIMLVPLKTVEPYTLLVDRNTGYVEALAPLDGATITPDTALTRSFLVQYVIARETFDINTIEDAYRKTVLWSDGVARSEYIASMQASNPESPLTSLPRSTVVEVQINSVSMLSETTAMVRFALERRDQNGRRRPLGRRVSVISWTYSGEPMTVADRLVNPLGFQVTRYRSDVEALPEYRRMPPVDDDPEGEAPGASRGDEEGEREDPQSGEIRQIGERADAEEGDTQ